MKRFSVALIVGHFLTLAIAGLTLIAISTSRAHAQMLCAPLPDILVGVKKRFNEMIVWTGESKSYRYIITANEQGSWTFIQVAKSGEPACIIAGGEKNSIDNGI